MPSKKHSDSISESRASQYARHLAEHVASVAEKARRRPCACRRSGLDSCCRYDREFRRQHTQTQGCCVCHRYAMKAGPVMKCFRCGESTGRNRRAK